MKTSHAYGNLNGISRVCILGEAEGILFGITEEIYPQLSVPLHLLLMETKTVILDGNF